MEERIVHEASIILIEFKLLYVMPTVLIVHEQVYTLIEFRLLYICHA